MFDFTNQQAVFILRAYLDNDKTPLSLWFKAQNAFNDICEQKETASNSVNSFIYAAKQYKTNNKENV